MTGQNDAFYKVCMVLPSVIEKAVSELDSTIVPYDTVIEELRALAEKNGFGVEGFSDCNGCLYVRV